jgi:ribonuclease BN (tRNA processing enzyme)
MATAAPVEPARGATLTVLGAGAILPRAGYGAAGYALRPAPGAPVTLLDCGPGTLRALAQSGVELREVERVLVSHFHPDHVLDLFALAFARRNPAFEAGPLELVGPRGLAGLLERGAAALGRWCRFEAARVVEVDPDARPQAMDHALGRLAWVHNEHTPESLSWRLDLAGGASLAFTGDTGERPQVAELAAGVGTLLCECSFPDEQAVPHHLTPASAGRVARAAGCGRLILTHFYPSMEPALAAARAAELFGGPIETARDGSRHPLPA